MTLASGVAGLQPWQKNTLTYSTEGKLLSAGGAKVDLEQILLPMALCADARLDDNGALIGDPTEGALIVLAEKGGISVDGAREMYPRVAEVPFDSDYKFMATFHNMTNEQGKPVVRCLCQGCAGCADRPQQLLLDAGRRGTSRSPTRTASWRSTKTSASLKPVNVSWWWHGATSTRRPSIRRPS